MSATFNTDTLLNAQDMCKVEDTLDPSVQEMLLRRQSVDNNRLGFNVYCNIILKKIVLIELNRVRVQVDIWRDRDWSVNQLPPLRMV
ncbi:hypothetical protein K1T71_010844 [Dendrolimus kikuchii]|uniref:Uncharacterized protein n=1 Tax=Dendrolimus kikuchii TaxID=765133 RepID=A0ACC1CQB0_9NEOP|nr:hypothetical protein K1T71_010844 [Dendrolimus kikuchii]